MVKKIGHCIKELIKTFQEHQLINKLIQKNNIGSDKVYDNKNGMIQYLPDVKKDLIQKEILKSGDYYEKIYLNSIKKNFSTNMAQGITLDVGANIGNHSIYFIKECEAEQVVAFEPILRTYNILCRNIEVNHLNSKIKPLNFGIGKANTRAAVGGSNRNNSGSTWLKEDNNGEIVIKTIDEFEFENVSFIKIDTEGFEYDVLLGGYKTIEKFKPIIWIEIQLKNFDKVNNLLLKLGYSSPTGLIKAQPDFNEISNYLYVANRE